MNFAEAVDRLDALSRRHDRQASISVRWTVGMRGLEWVITWGSEEHSGRTPEGCFAKLPALPSVDVGDF